MKHYLDHYEEVSLRKWDRPALSDYGGQDFTYAEVASMTMRLGAAFSGLGVRQGERIAICGRNCARWAMAFLAAARYRAVAVPLLYDFAPDTVQKLCSHSGSVILFTDRKVLAGIRPEETGSLKLVISLDDFSCLWASQDAYREVVAAAMAGPSTVSAADFPCERGPLDELAVINYTSGTTGDPKGVMLPARSISANVEYGLANVPVSDDDNSLSMLPMAHMFGLAFEFLYAFCGGSHVHFLGKTPGPSTLMQAFAQVRPYILVTVPLVMEKLVRSKVLPVLEKPLMRVLTRIPLVGTLIYRAVGRKLMAAFGGNVRTIPMGGAALNPKVEGILRKARVPYTVGYGMTECGPLIAYSSWKTFAKGSCGRELGEFGKVRVDSPDPANVPGEVLVKGDNVMTGYFRNEEATKAAFTEDGWMRTGDLGVIAPDGSVFLRGRSKCMILSASGQNIYPEEIECLINNMPGVEESLVVSRKGILVALVAMAKDAVQPSSELLNTLNRQLPSFSRIARFEVMTEPFVHTPKHSIKRSLYM